MKRQIEPGFTLVELLVVLAIIAVLISLLAPAIDKAIYQAELSICGARLHATGVGTLQYAMAHKRWYPHRQWNAPPASGGYLDKPPSNRLTAPAWGFDFRLVIRPYIPMAVIKCPLSVDVGIDIGQTGAQTAVDCSYPLWFGWQYLTVTSTRDSVAQGKGMHRMGDRLEWNNRFFNVLAGDWDDLDTSVSWSVGSHPDRDESMRPEVAREAGAVDAGQAGTNTSKWTYSRWYSPKPARGLVDLSFAYDDGAVLRLSDVRRGKIGLATVPEPGQEEPRITRVPLRVYPIGLQESTAMPVQ